MVYGETSEERVIRLDLKEAHSDAVRMSPGNSLLTPKLGIALSGGGARGLAHIGVLKALHREGISIDMVAGSSMGSIIGGLFAAGYTPEEIEQIALDMEWDSIFQDTPKRPSLFLAEKEARSRQLIRIPLEGANIQVPSALSTGQNMSSLLSNLTLRANFLANGDFDRLPYPYRSVAADLLSGKSVVIGQGDLAEAMRASTGRPIFLTPVEREGHRLVDGGILNNIPVNVVRDMGADIVLAVNVTSSLRPPNKLKAVWEIADQMVTIMMQDARNKQLEDADLVITPDLAKYSSTDFESVEALIHAGEAAMEAKLGELQTLLQTHSSVSSSEPMLLTAITFEGNRHVTDSYLKRVISLAAGQFVHDEQIKQALAAIYQSGYCCAGVHATVREGAEGIAITFHLMENPVFTDFRIVGNTLVKDEEILETVQSVKGRPLNHHTISKDIEAISDLYVRKGYILAQVCALPFRQTADVCTVSIEEGRIGRIAVEGNQHTRTSIVLREFPLQQGQLFNRQQAEQGISNIYATGLFDRAVLTVKQGNPDAEVIIKVEEKPFMAGELGIHFNKAHKSEAFVGLLNDNVLGFGIKLRLSAQVGEKRQLYALEERANRMWRTYLTHRVKAYYSREDRQVYGKNTPTGTYRDARVSTRFAFGQQMYRLGAATAEVRVENARLDSTSGTGFPQGKRKIRSLILRSILDSLDRFPFPRRGRRHHFYLESAGKVLGGTESYTKLFAFLDSFHTVRRKHTFRWRTAWGTADLTLPYSEHFRLGGGDDIYGYHYGQPFGDHNNLYGYAQDQFIGRQLLAGAVEYTLWIPKYFYLSLIYHTGNVWKATEKIRLSELHHAWGIRGAFDTLAGPISVGYGRTMEGNERMYFSAGYEF